MLSLYACQVAVHQIEGYSVGCPFPTPHHDGSTRIAIMLHYSRIVVTLSLLCPDMDLAIMEGPGSEENCGALPMQDKQIMFRCQDWADHGLP